ncbi:MAG: TIGR04282 family arsenosugar biosynthesis glycosyltransferase [Gammaproteobacteria bacterium]
MTTALAIFVKTPGLSPIKTRLAAGIGAEAALRFHYLAAAATAETVSACSSILTPYWAVAEDNPVTRDCWSGFPRLWQGTGTLGERLHRIHTALQSRHGSVLMIGADTPQLTPALLQQVVTTLHNPATAHILGPAKDGGFWLFGSKQPIPLGTWKAVPYSRADTAEALRNALQDTGRLDALPTLTDVDTADDLPILIEALQQLTNPLPAQLELTTWLTSMEMLSSH